MIGAALLFTIVSSTLALKPGSNCVDTSRYGEVQFNVSTGEVCSYRCDRVCQPREQQLCVDVPKTVCHLDAGVDCTTEETDDVLRCDKTEERTFVSKKCIPAGVKQLTEIKKMPQCQNVTKEQCDEKWIVGEDGSKVWGGNINCKPVTWRDCKLVDVVKTMDVPVHECIDDVDGEEQYIVPVQMEESVKCYKRKCQERAEPSCTTEITKECIDVKWMDCTEKIETTCKPVEVKTPWQSYDHLMRCSVMH